MDHFHGYATCARTPPRVADGFISQSREDILRPTDAGFDVGEISGLRLRVGTASSAARPGALRSTAGATAWSWTTTGPWRRQLLRCAFLRQREKARKDGGGNGLEHF